MFRILVRLFAVAVAVAGVLALGAVLLKSQGCAVFCANAPG